MHLTNIVYSYTQVCDHFNTIIRGGGWNKKEETAKSRPTGKSTQLWLQSIAPPSFFPDKPQTYDQSSYRLEGIFCTICMEIPEQPLQFECDHLVCLQCSCNWIEVGRTTPCPCCYGSDLYPSHARTPTAAITSVLGSLLVNCNRGCNKTVQTKHYKTHCSSQCTEFFTCSTLSPSKTTAAAILRKKHEAPVTATERKVVGSVLRRIMLENDGSVIKVPTQGQVFSFYYFF